MNTKRQSDHQVIQDIIDYYEREQTYYDTQAHLGNVRTTNGTQLEICYKILDGKRYWSAIEYP